LGLFSRKKKDVLTPEEIIELESLKQGVEITDPTNNKNILSLESSEAYSRDVGHGVARIDFDSMDTLNVSNNDVIEINGKRRTVVKCLPLYPSDEGKGIIRIDGIGRHNSGTEIGDTITVRKIMVVPAEKVVVAPLEKIPLIDERYLADTLESVPLIKGDNVMVQYIGGRLIFHIIEVTPTANAVLVTPKTIFHIAEKDEYTIDGNAHFDIIKERYAKGEITRKQFLEMKKDLK